MYNQTEYFNLARAEEKAGHTSAALLLYLSSFCAGFNCHPPQYPYQETEKIRRLQLRLGIPDNQLFSMIRSYGSLSDCQCQQLLRYSVDGNISQISAMLANVSYESEWRKLHGKTNWK